MARKAEGGNLMFVKQVEQKKRKKKGETKLSFDAGAVFDVKPSEDLQLDLEQSQYKAQKGQGGDRRV